MCIPSVKSKVYFIFSQRQHYQTLNMKISWRWQQRFLKTENLCLLILLVRKRRNCITKDQTFYDICLNGTVLEVAIDSQCDIRVYIPSQDKKTMKHTAYRQFVMWQQGPLGAGNWVVIPSCCVWKIRDKYPSPNNMYTGYKDR